VNKKGAEACEKRERERESESAEGESDLPRFLFFRCRVLTNERKGVDRISPPAVLI